MLGQLSRADTKGDAFLTGVQLIAHGCQRAFEVSDLPGLLPALTKVITICFAPCHQASNTTSTLKVQAKKAKTLDK